MKELSILIIREALQQAIKEAQLIYEQIGDWYYLEERDAAQKALLEFDLLVAETSNVEIEDDTT